MIANDRQYLEIFRRRRLAQKQGLTSEVEVLERQLEIFEAEHDGDRKGTWMPTFTGRRFWLLDPRPQDIDIEDVAQGLSRISRFNGMTLGPGYTVAQHSVLASYLVPGEFALHALLHDGPEAMAGDVVTPLKNLLGKVYEDIESGIMAAIAAAFGFETGESSWAAVHKADKIMLATEVRDLLPHQVIRVDPGQEPHRTKIDRVWGQDEARAVFLQRFFELRNGGVNDVCRQHDF